MTTTDAVIWFFVSEKALMALGALCIIGIFHPSYEAFRSYPVPWGKLSRAWFYFTGFCQGAAIILWVAMMVVIFALLRGHRI